ncbi:response regulator [Pseudobacter ginsenosidimutans]|uniref:LuxR family two component transcriptional regulator n=1 Tax=Pseudobacter ginsenosidimutans TaxID=661488 RepID=A0A4V2F0Q7_9BACT|nr:response regulator transcription factor [Pseudobacter ginsenosidimutans]QEC42187.1 response regulator transcription factor [Pseudobacter ginsenosidimutans]RZS70971.1 LuxR family two component transcriptional regulator [Pseudobacter ginsenosidimutans]
MVKVFITDDHELYLEGLTLLLGKQEGIQVVGTAMNGGHLLKQLPELEIDVLLLDVHLPDIEEEDLLKQIRVIKPELKVLYLTLMRGTRYIHKLVKYDIQGYLLKNASMEELKKALKAISTGEKYFSKEINILDTEQDFRNTITIEDKKVEEILSRREIEILTLICKEFSNSEIAEKLFLSVSTVETHRKNLIAKLGVNNTVGLVKFALKNRLID